MNPPSEELARTEGAAAGPDPAGEWQARQARALQVIDEALVAGHPGDPAWHKVRLMAADRVLGFRKGALPLPRMGELEMQDGTRVLRLRWASGRMVQTPKAYRGVLPQTDPAADER